LLAALPQAVSFNTQDLLETASIEAGGGINMIRKSKKDMPLLEADAAVGIPHPGRFIFSHPRFQCDRCAKQGKECMCTNEHGKNGIGACEGERVSLLLHCCKEDQAKCKCIVNAARHAKCSKGLQTTEGKKRCMRHLKKICPIIDDDRRSKCCYKRFYMQDRRGLLEQDELKRADDTNLDELLQRQTDQEEIDQNSSERLDSNLDSTLALKCTP